MTIKGRLGAIIGAMAGGPSQGELLRLADEARDRKQYQDAAELYDRALRSAAPNVDVLLLLQCGHMHKDAGNLSEAEARYLQALGVEPMNPEVLLQLGHFYKVAGRYADAKRYYQEALIARPGLTDAEDELRRLGKIPEIQVEKRPLERPNPARWATPKEPDELDRRLQRELLRLADDARDKQAISGRRRTLRPGPARGSAERRYPSPSPMRSHVQGGEELSRGQSALPARRSVWSRGTRKS